MVSTVLIEHNCSRKTFLNLRNTLRREKVKTLFWRYESQNDFLIKFDLLNVKS